MTALDIDRVSTSNHLHELAESFALEATMWAEPRSKNELLRTARRLADIARAVVTSADLDKARAYADAATMILRNVQGTRRFFQTVLTPPIFLRRGARHD